MVQITLTKNDNSIGYTVYFIFEGEEMSHEVYDTHQDAVEGFKKMANLIG